MQNNSTVLYYKYIPLITVVRRKLKISIENKKQKKSVMLNKMNKKRYSKLGYMSTFIYDNNIQLTKKIENHSK